MTMNIPLAHALTVSAFLLVPAAVNAASSSDLRASALKVLAPLPEKMPGAENDTPARVKLGRELFFEKKLSANNTQSCNSCHAVDQNRGGVDNEPTSPGAFGKRGGRNSPTVLNAGFHIAQFWDGRAKTLEDQAKGPVLNPGEMAMPSEAAVIEKLIRADPPHA
jgi:cytochrome c peroxidase